VGLPELLVQRPQEADVVDIFNVRSVAVVGSTVIPVVLNSFRTGDKEALSLGQFLNSTRERAGMLAISASAMKREDERHGIGALGRIQQIVGSLKSIMGESVGAEFGPDARNTGSGHGAASSKNREHGEQRG